EDLDVQHEAIELRFGERVGSFLLDGVLRRQYKERQIERKGRSARRHLVFLHRLQQGRLRLRGRAVDLVGQQDIRENGTFEKLKLPSAGGGLLLENVRAGNVRRHEVGRKLNPVAFQIEEIGRASCRERGELSDE